jgi:predicted small metal-binding protein
MHKHWSCTCGYVVHGNSDEEVVRRAQEHSRQQHKKEVTPEEVLRAAKEARH